PRSHRFHLSCRSISPGELLRRRARTTSAVSRDYRPAPETVFTGDDTHDAAGCQRATVVPPANYGSVRPNRGYRLTMTPTRVTQCGVTVFNASALRRAKRGGSVEHPR